MRFTLVDRITKITPGHGLSAVKNLTMSEEYLQDHFPLFPVMPGVLMLESLYQAGAWLVRVSDSFAYSMVELSEAKNVTFRDFVEPGQSLNVEIQIHKRSEHLTTVQGEATVEGRPAVKARLVLDSYNLADRKLASSTIDAYIISEMRRDYENLLGLSPTVDQAN